MLHIFQKLDAVWKVSRDLPGPQLLMFLFIRVLVSLCLIVDNTSVVLLAVILDILKLVMFMQLYLFNLYLASSSVMVIK